MSRPFAVELANCTETLLSEIGDKVFKRNDVALTYAMAAKSTEAVDWCRVNIAIRDRWSMSALHYIKERANDLLSGKIGA